MEPAGLPRTKDQRQSSRQGAGGLKENHKLMVPVICQLYLLAAGEFYDL